MNFYAIQVRTGSEEKFIKVFRRLHPDMEAELHFPMRRIDERRRGIIVQRTAGIFPGYLFVETEEGELLKYQRDFRRIEGFYRFLKSNQNIKALQGRDLEVVLHFVKRVGPVAGKSRVFFNENARVVVVDGPLLGLEGKIIKVDKRKGRAKIRLDLYDDFFSIDLAFEVIEPAGARSMEL